MMMDEMKLECRLADLEQRLDELDLDLVNDFDTIYKKVNNATTKADELLKRVDALENQYKEDGAEIRRMLECGIPTERPQQPAPVELSEKASEAVYNSRSNGLNITMTYGRCYVATLDDEDVVHGFTLASLVERINAHFEGK